MKAVRTAVASTALISAAVVIGRRLRRRPRAALGLADGLLIEVPPASPGGLELISAARAVVRELETAYAGGSAGKDQ